MGRIPPMALALQAQRPEKQGGHRPASMAHPIGDAGPEWCPAAHTTRSAPWSPRAWRASGVATGDGLDGEVWRDAWNEL
jgi:hypothetical protein